MPDQAGDDKVVACHVEQRKFSDLFTLLDNAAIAKRLPYVGAMELTYRCNQACRHCYCNLKEDDKLKAEELSTGQVMRILDEAADAGCLWLLLTGGEVLLKEDFLDIYTHAVKRGMLVEVFTNATLIDGYTAARFAEFQPLGIDVSIYGSGPDIHDRITGVSGSFKKMMDGLECLRKHNVRFSLKTVLMTLNYPDLAGMRALAESLKVKFRYDTLLCPRSDGGMSPVRYRLSADTMAGLDIEEDYDSCEKIFSGLWGKAPEEVVSCGAGVFAFNVNPYGDLSPCTMFKSFQYPLKRSSFDEAWAGLVRDYEKRCDEFVPAECRTCKMLFICPNCPAWSEIEAKSFDVKVDYICEYASCLEKKYFNKKKGGVAW